MPFCATCGAQVEGRFCAKCGSPIVAGNPAAAPPPPPPPNYQAPPPSGYPQQGYPQQGYPQQGGYPPAAVAAPMADNVASCLCYALGFITGILFLVLSPYNQNRVVRFHAFQSIFYSVFFIAIRIVLGFALLPLGFWLAIMVSWIIGMAGFVLWILLMVWAYQGKMVVLPAIGPLARQQAG